MKKAEKKFTQSLVSLSYSLSGKMKDVLALSTDCVSCGRCVHRYHTRGNGARLKDIIAMVKAGAVIAICAICYAMKYLKVRPNVRKAYENNGKVLSNSLSNFELRAIAFEIISALRKNQTHKFRLEAFGDLTSLEQATNYLKLCSLIYCLKRNYKIQIALWTKNYDILIKAFETLPDIDKLRIRKILSVILSSVFIGIPVSDKIVDKVEKCLGMPVKVFTVDVNHSAKTNCGAKCCNTCGLCYNAFNNVKYIWEVIK